MISRRSARAARKAVLGDDWIRPYWLERQLDPRSTSFVAHGGAPVMANVTHRNWTTVGTVSSAATATVDPRGLLTPSAGGWSVDWWIGAEDRWHFPSREAAVRQQLVDDTPVVETSMRIPGGDAVQRVYAVPDGLAVIEITNDTPTPIAVGLAIRPYGPEGLAVVEQVGLDDRTVTVDGRPALLFAKRPQRLAVSTFRDGDAAHRVTGEELATDLSAGVRCGDGLATATFLFPLAHRQTLRVVVPLPPDQASTRPDPLPDSDAVTRSWRAQTSSRGLRFVLPESRLASAVEANRGALLLFRAGGPASVAAALDHYGFSREAAEALSPPPARRRTLDAQALWATAEHWRLTGSVEHVDAEAVFKSARSIDQSRGDDRDGGASYGDRFWSLRGLLDGAALLRALGADPVADECDRWAASRRTDLEKAMAHDAERLGTDALPACPQGRIEPRVVDALAAAVPLGLLPAEHPAMASTAQAIRDRFCVGPAVYGGIERTGLGTTHTLQLASVELESGDRAALDRLTWLLDVASPTWTWPEAVHPVLGGGCLGDGHDSGAAAAFLSFVRRLLVRETFDGGLALCSMVPDAWTGQALEVHDAPTHFGSMSFAVRYHGERPALLWDLKARIGTGPVRLTAPGLDAGWSTTEARGETLLAASSVAPAPIDAEGSFS